VQLQSVTIKNFRCFDRLVLTFEQPIVLIEGANGSGKTSLLEAIHYACYLRSFRTRTPGDLVQAGAPSFFVKAVLSGSESHEVHVGFADKKRLVKLNQKAITTYKELFDVYRVVTITEDDLNLVRGGPEDRRAFIDQVCLMQNPEYALLLRSLKQILNSRNAILKRHSFNKEMYDLWSAELFKISAQIGQIRCAVLAQLEQELQELILISFQNRYAIAVRYQASIDYQLSAERVAAAVSLRMADEMRQGRSLFGAHLDDLIITFQGRKARLYASRGQQKLIVLLLKMAHIRLLYPSIVLLDDFMTDFDHLHMQELVQALISLKSQLIFTIPLTNSSLEQILQPFGLQRIGLQT
jgi:DNA replication and repair protein RecF